MGVSRDGARQQALGALDSALGPLRIGETAISRALLDSMGAQLDGMSIPLARLNVAQADQVLIDQIGFSASHLKASLASADTGTTSLASAVLFELASLRSAWVPALLDQVEAPDTTINRLDRLLQSVQSVNLNDLSRVQSLPGWADKVKSHGLQTLGSGLQLYSFYSAIRGVSEAIRTGDTRELLFEGGAFTAEVVSLGVELALERAGTKMMSAAQSVYRGFCASRAGLMLQRGAGLIASVLTLPFDIAQAAIALSKAAESEGKAAQDLYVEAGFSLASAALSIALGAAALAGFSAAGPVGLVASAVLIIGARAYAAGRVVDEIHDYIELSIHERLRTGWFAFIGVELDENVTDRYKIKRTDSVHTRALKAQARALLDGELKSTVQAIVNGKFEVRLQTIRHWRHQWAESEGESAYVQVREPVVQDLDDYFDARKDGAIDTLPEAHWGTKGPEKGVVWLLGGGNDTVLGVTANPNHFRYTSGKKYLLGGSADDEFVFEVPRETFSAPNAPVHESTLIGAAGVNTLNLVGDARAWGRAGFNVNLGAGTVHLNTDTPRKCMALWNIQNISTLPGADNIVTGSNEANRIVMQGRQDIVDANAGDDHLLILEGSARVNGGPGADYYEISERVRDVVIVEDGQQASLILLNWAFSRIQRWWIMGGELRVASVLGEDGELPGPSVTVQGVYTSCEGKRYLENKQFSFLTSDGYRLIPLLLDELEATGEYPVSMEVIVPQGPILSPAVLGPGQSISLAARKFDYFFSRGFGESVIDASAGMDTSRCSLYVDYDSQELSVVYTHYHVATRRQSNFDYLYYTAVEIRFVFVGGRVLTLNNYAAQPSDKWTSVGGVLQASALKPRLACVVVMRDGVSYRLLPPVQSYISDHASPGHKRMDGSASLVLRNGFYPFFRPRRAKSINLTTDPQRVIVKEPPHTETYQLFGQGGVYELELRSWATLELSTPSAGARKSGASTWDIHCTGLVEDVDLDNIVVDKDQIKIGSVSVQILSHDDPGAPLENIRIYSRQGVRYDVRLDIGKVFIASVAARAGRSVEDVLKLLRHGRQRSSVSMPHVNVVGLSLRDGTYGTVYYDWVSDRWVLETEKTRQISSGQLMISS